MDQTPNNALIPPAPKRSGWWRWSIAVGMIIVGGFIISYPFFPKLEFALSKKTSVFPYETRLSTSAGVTNAVTLTGLPETQNKPAPKDNRLVIPSIGVNMPILEGPDEKVLDRGGIWHIPNTSDPSKGSNTVLSGHRWQYLPPSSRTLYLLDKVTVGEPVIVYWRGQEFDYRISRTAVVDPSHTEILNGTANPQLTIFTCTPLFSTKQRLVLYGDLIS